MVTIQEIMPYVIGALGGFSITCLFFAVEYGKLGKKVEELEKKYGSEEAVKGED